jgi:hypothetical protein
MILEAIVAIGRCLGRAPFRYMVLVRVFFVKGNLVHSVSVPLCEGLRGWTVEGVC